MAGNVNEAKAQIVEVEVGEAEVDGDAASFFFRKTIRIDAGQSTHQGALSVIDVTCGADNQGRHVSHRLHRLFRNDLLVKINVLRNYDIGPVTSDCRLACALAHL